MLIREIMTTQPESISFNESLHAAAEKMRALDVGVLPVADDGRIVGVLTDRDIVLRSTADGQNPDDAKVEQVMTRDLHWAQEDADCADAAKEMETSQIRRLLVRNANNELVGIVSVGDLAVRLSDQGLSGEVVTEVSKPSEPAR